VGDRFFDLWIGCTSSALLNHFLVYKISNSYFQTSLDNIFSTLLYCYRNNWH
jgi:hypothetical protein